MGNINKFSKIFLFISFTAGVLWLGSYFARLTVTYQIFQGNQYQLNNYINSGNLPGILTTINAVVILTCVLYIIFILSFIIFLITSGLSLKQNGWFFIIVCLVFITLPFEFYLMTIDYQSIMHISSTAFNAGSVLNLYIRRFKVLSSFPLVEILCYFAIIFFILFQPFKLKTKAKL